MILSLVASSIKSLYCRVFILFKRKFLSNFHTDFLSQISGITLLAVPADVYSYGVTYWLGSGSVIVVGILTAYVFFPVFQKSQITSAYEYLEMRFDNRIRVIASLLITISILLYLPIVIYIPALAFSQG